MVLSISICISSLEKWLVKFSAQFLIGSFEDFSLLLDCKSSLYILDIY